jgi:hypothetical protein
MTRRENLAALFMIPVFPLAAVPASPVLRIWRDNSGSMSEEDLKRFSDTLVSALEPYADVVAGVSVVRFSDGRKRLFTTPAQPFLWGSVSDGDSRQLNAGRQVPPFIKWLKLAHDKAEEEQRSESSRHFAARVEKAIADLKKYLEASPAETASCTLFSDLAARIAEDDLPFNLTITDGWNDCNETWTPAKDIHGRHVIVLLPRKKGDLGLPENSIFEQRRRALQVLFPTAKIVRPSAIQRHLTALFGNPS